MRLQLLRLVISLKISRQFINQREGKPKPIATCTGDFSRALSKLHGITANLDWFMSLFAAAVIGRSNYFGICFTKIALLYKHQWNTKSLHFNIFCSSNVELRRNL